MKRGVGRIDLAFSIYPLSFCEISFCETEFLQICCGLRDVLLFGLAGELSGG